MSECEKIAEKYFPSDKFEAKVTSYNETCVIDFTERDIKDELAFDVNCDDYCLGEYPEEEQEQEYEACLQECRENVKLAATGSVHINKKTLEVESATIPLSPGHFYKEVDYEYEYSEEEVEKLQDKLAEKGCVPEELAWIHPHELRPGHPEWEEDPSVYYIHVKKEAKNKCKLPNLRRIIP